MILALMNHAIVVICTDSFSLFFVPLFHFYLILTCISNTGTSGPAQSVLYPRRNVTGTLAGIGEWSSSFSGMAHLCFCSALPKNRLYLSSLLRSLSGD